MGNYVGIDLGTTNSAICSFDGVNTRIWKSPEQNDVTPSALFFDRRGNKFVGKRAYDSEPQAPQNAAKFFKRAMGTRNTFFIKPLQRELTPVECSTEILKTLYGYLPEELRQDQELGTVITVPAAFNQMQKDATREAAENAGIAKVALMQEPVAAVMSIMRVLKTEGLFLVYDFGGGTLDVAIAESIGHRVNLLANGGKAMCGGRDFDRAIFDNVIRDWLENQFNLPDSFITEETYKPLHRMSLWAAERAKIDLSAAEETHISLTEQELRTKDLNGEEIYLDIPLNRDTLSELMEPLVNESIEKAREVIKQAGLQSSDFASIVFIGGPTNYKPLRDQVAFELGIPGEMVVNPMTAVAEGAAIFAESIDWTTENRQRKNTREKLSLEDLAGVSFNYIARTPEDHTKIAVQITKDVLQNAEFQVDNLDDGWTSGRVPLQHGKILTVALPADGENHFKVTIYDSFGNRVKEENIVISKVKATVEAIPISFSIGVEVKKQFGGEETCLDWLIRQGEQLPKKGQRTYKTTAMLKAGSADSINFNLWEGESEETVSDNKSIGVIKISGDDFDDGVIPKGADLVCDFEILDVGTIGFSVSVPSIGSTFTSSHRFYSRTEGENDYSTPAVHDQIMRKCDRISKQLDGMIGQIKDERLDRAREKVDAAYNTSYSDEADSEAWQAADEGLQEAMQLLSKVRQENKPKVRQMDLNTWIDYYEGSVQQYARPEEDKDIKATIGRARSVINRRDNSFENYMSDLHSKAFFVMWHEDWFVLDVFKDMIRELAESGNDQYFALKAEGEKCIQNKDMDQLRKVVIELIGLTRDASQGMDMRFVNIIKG